MKRSATSKAFVLGMLIASAGLVISGTTSATELDVANQSPDSDTSWLPFPVDAWLHAKWRKYGEFDYRQLGSQYRSATLFNFGATAKAAGLTASQIQELARASRPTPDDVRHLDDPALISNFKQHEKEFEQLRLLANEDAHVLRIAPDYTTVDKYLQERGEKIGLAADRWNEYRQHFATLKIPEGLVRSEDFPNALLFVFKSKGLCVAGTSSGYVHSTEPLAPLVTSPAESLGVLARKRGDGRAVYVFVRLATSWYAFYELDG